MSPHTYQNTREYNHFSSKFLEVVRVRAAIKAVSWLKHSSHCWKPCSHTSKTQTPTVATLISRLPNYLSWEGPVLANLFQYGARLFASWIRWKTQRLCIESLFVCLFVGINPENPSPPALARSKTPWEYIHSCRVALPVVLQFFFLI